ncbi:CapA family protein [Streptococcus sp. S784/96/1]|uniref:CapA family protein n=1 Tax=Streptococcus sp. S784/96/1 TaxID=2653499 RepID=UPI001386A8F6|nr:CapA family protein [Streptococcus sp. S784/96/1]
MDKRHVERQRKKDRRLGLLVSLLVLVLFLAFLLERRLSTGDFVLNNTIKTSLEQEKTKEHKVQTARVVANGDILIHDILYTSAAQEDGSYHFDPYFTYVKEWIQSADLAIGDYEGTISPDFPLAGYPLFNAPSEIAQTIKKTGYDVVDLAHNHILDSHLSGALNTVETFNALGIDTIGIYTKNREKQDFLIKEVNGIKIAILGYSYGYNGMETTLTDEEYQKHMSDLDEAKIKKELKKAEKLADVTLVMPQMGVEYALEPTAEQVDLYHKMIDWGADVVFGGHPHVAEPSEIVEHKGDKKLIIYSMGNFISNQTYEMLGNYWTERGLLMDVTFEKKGDKTVIKTAEAHPAMVWAWNKGTYNLDYNYPNFDYRVMILEDFLEGGKYRSEIPVNIQEKVDIAYTEMNELVGLHWK